MHFLLISENGFILKRMNQIGSISTQFENLNTFSVKQITVGKGKRLIFFSYSTSLQRDLIMR
jgi:hypothetical protein